MTLSLVTASSDNTQVETAYVDVTEVLSSARIDLTKCYFHSYTRALAVLTGAINKQI